jgi:hypothetical protein
MSKLSPLLRHQVTGLLDPYVPVKNLDDDLLLYLLGVFAEQNSGVDADADDVFFSMFPELATLNDLEKARLKDGLILIATGRVPQNTSIISLVDKLHERLTGPETPLEDVPVLPGFEFSERYYNAVPLPPPPADSSKQPATWTKKAAAPPRESRELDELLGVLEAHGVPREGILLDCEVVAYLLEMVSSSVEGEEEDGGGEGGLDCVALLQQYVPELCDDDSETAAAALAAAVDKALELARARAATKRHESAEARRQSASRAGLQYTALVDVILETNSAGAGGGGGGGGGVKAAAHEAQVKAAVAAVLALVEEEHPDLTVYASEPLVRFAYLHHASRNVEETVQFLKKRCDCDEGRARLEAQREAHARREAEEEGRKRAAIKSVVDRYEDVEVLPKYDSKGVALDKKKKDLVVFLDKAYSDGKHTRFRDNVAVSSNGEKFITIKNPAEDYDGGSRGRIKTKGKRGPGWR